MALLERILDGFSRVFILIQRLKVSPHRKCFQKNEWNIDSLFQTTMLSHNPVTNFRTYENAIALVQIWGFTGFQHGRSGGGRNE